MSSSQIVPGGNPTPALALVATDNQTIFGSGSVEDPLRTGQGGGGTFRATFVSLGPDPLPGMPVVVSVADADPGTVCTVTPGAADNIDSSLVIGLIASVSEDGSVNVQSSGQLTLTAAQWHAVGATVGGLAKAEAYFLSTAAGVLDDVPPSSGNYSVQVGAALNALTMVLSCPAVPILVP